MDGTSTTRSAWHGWGSSTRASAARWHAHPRNGCRWISRFASLRPAARAGPPGGRDGQLHHREPIQPRASQDRKSTRLNSSHLVISYAVFCLKKKKKTSGEVNIIVHQAQTNTNHKLRTKSITSRSTYTSLCCARDTPTTLSTLTVDLNDSNRE